MTPDIAAYGQADWFCGPLSATDEHLNVASPPANSFHLPSRRTKLAYHDLGISPDSLSAVPSSTESYVIPLSTSTHLGGPLLTRPLHSRSLTSLSSEPSERAVPSLFLSPTTDSLQKKPQSINTRLEALDLPETAKPLQDGPQDEGQSGSYLYMIKERLMGMYLSVYVYKGCEHLIKGE